MHNVNIGKTKKKIVKLNISSLPRDAIIKIRLDTAANGSYENLKGRIKLTIKNFQLAKSVDKENVEGWKPAAYFVLPQLGFSRDGRKLILTQASIGQKFIIRDANAKKVLEGFVKSSDNKNLLGVQIIDISQVNQAGKYIVEVNHHSMHFNILNIDELYLKSILYELNFIYSERCGYPIPGVHGICHVDTIATHNGKKVSFNGGWHDAGDLSQQTLHTGEVSLALARTAKKLLTDDEELSNRLFEEARWGLDFVFKMRFGDGYRASSAGVSRWTDNQIGNMDDSKARVHNNPYENFLFAAIESECATCFADKQFSKQLLQIAKEDFSFAEEEFSKHPYVKEPIMWEHTYNTSKCIYDATAVFAAGSLYQRTHEQHYAKTLKEFAERMLACQQTKSLVPGSNDSLLKGMFYRDKQHKVFQHFNHQSREHMLGEAFRKMLEIDDENSKWKKAAILYANYLLKNSEQTYPYNMFSSGFYFDDEYKDKESFERQNLLIDDNAPEEFQEQLHSSTRYSDHLYFKNFPVWFSFRGNNAVLLSTGRSAVILGKLLNKQNLLNAGEAQLQWITGFNPFSQSLIYGLGSKFCSEYASSSGEQMGEIPVGIETNQNKDIPYWPSFNNATYKEVWISNSGQWLSLVSELL